MRYGEIDIWHFYRSRFLRIWPTFAVTLLVIYCLYYTEENRFVRITLPAMFFLNNMVGPSTWLWSVAVEFQFYLISPFIVRHMARGIRPWLWPLILIIVSIASSFVSIVATCPGILQANSPTDDSVKACQSDLWFHHYEKTYCRMSPYLAGMYAAYFHLKGN